LIILHPKPGAYDIIAGFLQNGARPAQEYNQVGPERFHGIKGSDLGAVGHNFIVLVLVLVLGFFDYDCEEEDEDDLNWSMLVQIFLNALGFSQQIRRVLLGQFDELLQRLHRRPEFIGKLLVFLVLPSVSQRREAGLQQNQPVLQVGVEPVQFVGEPPHLFGIHDCLCHNFPFVGLWGNPLIWRIAGKNLTWLCPAAE
jgi:hypothetical protein